MFLQQARRKQKEQKESWSFTPLSSWRAKKWDKYLYDVHLWKQFSIRYLKHNGQILKKKTGVRVGVTFCVVWRHEVASFVYILEKHMRQNDGIFIIRCK